MRAFVVACLAAALIAICAVVVLNGEATFDEPGKHRLTLRTSGCLCEPQGASKNLGPFTLLKPRKIGCSHGLHFLVGHGGKAFPQWFHRHFVKTVLSGLS